MTKTSLTNNLHCINYSLLLQVFLGVTIFGLFHGLVYLPVLLSWIGPRPYYNAREEQYPEDNIDTRYPMYIAGRPSIERRRRAEASKHKVDVYQVSGPTVDEQRPFSHGVSVRERAVVSSID